MINLIFNILSNIIHIVIIGVGAVLTLSGVKMILFGLGGLI